MAASDSTGLAGWCAEEREPLILHAHDREAEQREAEPAGGYYTKSIIIIDFGESMQVGQ